MFTRSVSNATHCKHNIQRSDFHKHFYIITEYQLIRYNVTIEQIYLRKIHVRRCIEGTSISLYSDSFHDIADIAQYGTLTLQEGTNGKSRWLLTFRNAFRIVESEGVRRYPTCIRDYALVEFRKSKRGYIHVDTSTKF